MMPKPRVFISSTYFDLRQIRADLGNFIISLGFEPVLFESGMIGYDLLVSPAEASIQEVDRCNFLVSIIGSKVGSSAPGMDHSVSVAEFKRALQANKQVFVFIPKEVLTEFRTFKINKSIADIKYWSVENVKIFEFIEEIQQLPRNNAFFGFEKTEDITEILRMQFAALFHELLYKQTSIEANSIVGDLKIVASSLTDLIRDFGKEHTQSSSVVREIILSHHPLIRKIRDTLSVQYRVLISDIGELRRWLRARQFRLITDAEQIDNIEIISGVEDISKYFVFQRISSHRNPSLTDELYVAKSLFEENGNLKSISDVEWNDSYLVWEPALQSESQERARLSWSNRIPSNSDKKLDDDIPF